VSRRRPTPPKIGSPKWDRELAAIGLDRAAVDEELSAALRTSGAAEVDAHSLYFPGEPAEEAAAWILLHQDHPSYAALMYLRLVWSHGNKALRAWIVRQFAAMLVHGPGPVAESGEYGLWVDYFETPSDAPEMFTGLAEQLPHSHWHRLLRSAGPVPWAAKRDRFLEAAELPALHAVLAEGIAGSFYDLLGDVDAVEAAQLLERITVADDELRTALVEATTEPLRLRSGSAVIVADPAWKYPGSFLIDAMVSSGRERWVYGSELVADDVVYGKLVHFAFPFDPTMARRLVRGRPLARYRHWWYRIEGALEHVEALVDRDDLQVWPPGLREHVARGRNLPAPDQPNTPLTTDPR
jgi:hypothetical protein